MNWLFHNCPVMGFLHLALMLVSQMECWTKNSGLIWNGSSCILTHVQEYLCTLTHAHSCAHTYTSSRIDAQTCICLHAHLCLHMYMHTCILHVWKIVIAVVNQTRGLCSPVACISTWQKALAHKESFFLTTISLASALKHESFSSNSLDI